MRSANVTERPAPGVGGGGFVQTNGRAGRRVKPYSTSEAAALLGVSQRTVIRLCIAGKLRCEWTPGHGRRRIPVAALEEYRRRNT